MPPNRVVKFVEVHEHDVAGALLIWRHPEQAIELRVAGCGEGMRTVGINGLACQQLHRLGVFGGQLIMWQVWMEIKRRDVFEKTQFVNVPKGRKRRDLLRAFDERWPETPQIMHRDVESLHQRTGILPEALLARHKCVAMVEVFHLALLEVVGEADIMVRREQQACAFALEPLLDGRDFLRRGFLLGKEVVESKHHERVGICENPFVNWQLETRLVNALENGNSMAGGLAGNTLEVERGTVEKLQRTRNPL